MYQNCVQPLLNLCMVNVDNQDKLNIRDSGPTFPVGTGVLSSYVKWPLHEANDLPQSSA